MGRMMVVLGVLILIGGAGFFTLIQAVDAYESAAEIVGGFMCEPDERLTFERLVVQQAVVGTTTFYYCENEAGQRRQINERLRMVVFIGFVPPLMIGILLMTAGVYIVRRNRRREQLGATFSPTAGNAGAFSTMSGSTINVSHANLSPQQKAQVEDILQSVSGSFGISRNDGSLTERLQDLQQAHDKGLISSEEYERIRKAILDQADDT